MTKPPEATAPEMPDEIWAFNNCLTDDPGTFAENNTYGGTKYIRAALIKPEPVAVDLNDLRKKAYNASQYVAGMKMIDESTLIIAGVIFETIDYITASGYLRTGHAVPGEVLEKVQKALTEAAAVFYYDLDYKREHGICKKALAALSPYLKGE